MLLLYNSAIQWQRLVTSFNVEINTLVQSEEEYSLIPKQSL